MKTVNKNMTNGEIYTLAVGLMNNLKEDEIRFPAAVAYSIQKNKASIGALAEEIEKSRVGVIQHYASEQEGDSFVIAPENIDDANRELGDLLNLVQEVKIYTFKIEDISEVQLTSAQMNAIMFMIEEDEVE